MLHSASNRADGRAAFPLWQRAALFSLAYFVCAQAGSYLSARDSAYLSFWLPAGLTMAVLLLNRTRDWPWLLLAAFPANFLFDFFHARHPNPAVILCFYGANVVQSATGAWLVRRFVAERPALATLKEFFGLAAWAALLSTMLGATIGAATQVHFGLSHSFAHSWKVWWGSTAMAILVLTPFILTWFSKPNGARHDFTRPKKIAEALLLLLALALYEWLLFSWSVGILSAHRTWVMPLLLWAGLRFGPRGATAASLLLSLSLAFFTSQFLVGLTAAQVLSGEYVFPMQTVMAMASLVALIPAIVLGERNRTMASLRDSEESLRATIENTPYVAVQWYDREARVTYWNRASEIIYGWTAAEAAGKTLDELVFTGAQAAKFQKALVEIGRTGVPFGPVEFPFHRRDGATGVILSTIFQIQAPSGEPRFACMDVDLTRRKQAEALTGAQMQVLEMIAAGRPLAETLTALLRMVEAQSPEMLGSILLLDADGLHLRHGAAPSLPAEFSKAIDGAASGPCAGSCGTAAFRREPVFVADIASDPLWADYKNLALPHGLRACWSTPIFNAQRDVLGTFAVYYRTPGLPDEQHRQLIEMATHTAAICISKHRAEARHDQAVAREQQARIEYTLQIIGSQEAERKRIAAELHDSIGQNLLLIKNLAQMASRAQQPAQLYEHLATINNLATQCIAEARQISHDLHPPQLDHLGLARALEAMTAGAAQASEAAFTRKFDAVDEIFSNDAAMNLYRIAQESLNNILKHSGAKNVDLRLERDIHEVVLRITDDGCGFTVDNPDNGGKGLGLKNITERARMLGGKLTVESSPGGGTRIEVTVPIAEKTA